MSVSENESSRLFFALWPDAALRALIAQRVQVGLRRGGGRPVRADNMHITLAFLGEVEAERIDCIRDAADGVQAPAFTLRLERLGYWRRARVVWLGPPERHPEPPAVVARLWEALMPCGCEPESRPFFPHMTLTRKANRGPRARSIDPIDWRVSEFALVSSNLYEDGVQYEVLRRWPLEG